jgi:hypothetical protein
MGVRYEYVSPELERRNQVSNFDPSARGGLGAMFSVDPNASGTKARTTIDADKNNFAPRIGIAYQVTDRLVFRAGGGYFYQAYDRHGSESQLGLNPPFLVDVRESYLVGEAPRFYMAEGMPADILDPAPVDDLDRVSKLMLRTVVGNRRAAYIGQASAGFQYAITNNFSLEIDWSGNSAHRLWRLGNLNQLRIETPGQPGILPFPDFRGDRSVPAAPGASPTTIEWLDSIGNSNYNAMQLKVERRFADGFGMLLSYTWSKAIADCQEMLSTSGDERGFGRSVAPQDYWNLKAERALYLNDTPRRLVFSWIWDLPYGRGKVIPSSGGVLGFLLGDWQLNGIATFADGQPLGIISPIDTSRSGGLHISRADILHSDNLSNRTVEKYLDTTAYALPAAYFFGNSSPTSGVRVPGLNNWDLSLFKNFIVNEDVYFQFRTEFFNAFNRPSFQGPNPRLTDPTFGQIRRSQGDPRQIQFALKIYF